MADSGVHTLVPLMQTAETPDNYKVKKKQPRRSSGLQRRNNKALWGVRAAARRGQEASACLPQPPSLEELSAKRVQRGLIPQDRKFKVPPDISATFVGIYSLASEDPCCRH